MLLVMGRPKTFTGVRGPRFRGACQEERTTLPEGIPHRLISNPKLSIYGFSVLF